MMCSSAGELGPELDPSTRIQEHLARWELRSFSTETAYYEWQRQVIAPAQLQRLADLAQRRQGDDGAKWDVAFYDLAATPDILPVVYSQRFEYFEQVGLALVQQLHLLSSTASVLDVGCGVGILTTWYASMFPDVQFRGVDRSPQSIVAAERHAAIQNLSNVEFSCCTFPSDIVSGQYDVIIATQALFQSEVDPGLPSQSWKTFERAQDATTQLTVEKRTGLGSRLESLLPSLSPSGTLLLFEKTSHLGRRVLFQRGLMRHGFSLVQPPRYLHYANLGEVEREGPLYIVSREHPSGTDWDESPHTTALQGLYRCAGDSASFVYSRLEAIDHDEFWTQYIQGQSMTGAIIRNLGGITLGCVKEGSLIRGIIVGGANDEAAIRDVLEILKDPTFTQESFEQWCAHLWPANVVSDSLELVPLYENHSPAAQHVWADLVGRQVIQSETSEEEDGRARHIELGECLGGLVYMYWANTYDQRQLVIMDAARKFALLDYYNESVKQQT